MLGLELAGTPQYASVTGPVDAWLCQAVKGSVTVPLSLRALQKQWHHGPAAALCQGPLPRQSRDPRPRTSEPGCSPDDLGPDAGEERPLIQEAGADVPASLPRHVGDWLVQLASGAFGSCDTHSAPAWRVWTVTAGTCVVLTASTPCVWVFLRSSSPVATAQSEHRPLRVPAALPSPWPDRRPKSPQPFLGLMLARTAQSPGRCFAAQSLS